MKNTLMGWTVCVLAFFSPSVWAQEPVPAAESPAVPASPAPQVRALIGELELDRIIEVHVDHLADWNQALGGPAAVRTGPASVHPAWQLIPYLDGRALSGVTPLAVDLGQGRLQFHLRITEANRDTWTHLLSPLTFQRAVRFSVGLVQVDPFATDLTVDNRRALLIVINWRWLLAAVLIVATLSVAFCSLAMHTTLLMERYKKLDGTLSHRFSIAKVQLALWFLVIFGAFLVIWLVTGNVDSLNSSILSLWVQVAVNTSVPEILCIWRCFSTWSTAVLAMSNETPWPRKEVAALHAEHQRRHRAWRHLRESFGAHHDRCGAPGRGH